MLKMIISGQAELLLEVLSHVLDDNVATRHSASPASPNVVQILQILVHVLSGLFHVKWEHNYKRVSDIVLELAPSPRTPQTERRPHGSSQKFKMHAYFKTIDFQNQIVKTEGKAREMQMPVDSYLSTPALLTGLFARFPALLQNPK